MRSLRIDRASLKALKLLAQSVVSQAKQTILNKNRQLIAQNAREVVKFQVDVVKLKFP